MQVEIYEEQEISNTPEEKEGALEIIEKLGLTKQKEIWGGEVVNTFRKFTAEELFVFQVMFPNIVELGKYDQVIPIRVLHTIDKFKELNPDIKVYLCCPEPGEKDPVVFGCNYNWLDVDCFIIARFGEALEDFSILKKRAIEKFLNMVSHPEATGFNKMFIGAKALMRGF
jgi:hypothetical protein